MKYTVIGPNKGQKREYHFFGQYVGGPLVAIVTFDGEHDLYSVQVDAPSDAVIGEIRRKYRDEFERDPESVTIYRIAVGWSSENPNDVNII